MTTALIIVLVALLLIGGYILFGASMQARKIKKNFEHRINNRK